MSGLCVHVATTKLFVEKQQVNHKNLANIYDTLHILMATSCFCHCLQKVSSETLHCFHNRNEVLRNETSLAPLNVQHSYACLMSLCMTVQQIPRLFGPTASPLSHLLI